jgi:hypothetical protein
MKPILSIISAISILILFGPYSAFSQSEGIDNLETQYGIYIDGYISKLESKTGMLRNTRSERLRKQALLDCLKINYLKTNKEDLTELLAAYSVGEKPYKIQRFLDGNFFNTVKRAKNMVAFYNCDECGREINLKAL